MVRAGVAAYQEEQARLQDTAKKNSRNPQFLEPTTRSRARLPLPAHPRVLQPASRAVQEAASRRTLPVPSPATRAE